MLQSGYEPSGREFEPRSAKRDDRRVHGELIVKPLREADTALRSGYANGSYPTWLAICQRIPQLRQGLSLLKIRLH